MARTNIDIDEAACAAVMRRYGCRGETVRKMVNCLVAAVAIRNDIPLVHADRDYEVLARHTALRVQG